MGNLNYDDQLSDEDGYISRYSYMEDDEQDLDNYDEDLYEEELNND